MKVKATPRTALLNEGKDAAENLLKRAFFFSEQNYNTSEEIYLQLLPHG